MSDIKVCFSNLASNEDSVDGIYMPNQRKIVIDKNLSQSEIISTLLHELGHFIDDLRNPYNNLANRYHLQGRANDDIGRELTFRQKKALLKTEREAWINARGLASQLRIPLGNWFVNDERTSLKTYYSIRVRKE